MAKNDWIVANINNPNLDVFDLTALGGMTTDNTQFLSREEYLKSNFIKDNPNFKDASGNFSEDKFNRFYDYQAARWGEFQEDRFPEGLKLDYFDTRRTKDSRVKDINFDIGLEYDPKNGKFVGNPDRVKMGIEGWNVTSERTKSEKEIAESQRIFNPVTGAFEDKTPEDSALFASPVNFIKSMFEDPLVLAVYDKDEVDEYGIQHRKGEKKLNDRGTYYTERLAGRSPLNKEVISFADLLTKEDSTLNRIDFMDSDDLEKSVGGVVAKSVARIAPMFFGPVGAVYSSALIAREMAKAMPMLYGVGANLFGSGDSEVPEWMNTLAAKGEQFSTKNSVYAGEHPFSFENFANLAADVALQWGQQKQIAKAVQALGGKAKLADAEKRAKALFDAKSQGKLAGMAKVDDVLAAGVKAEDAWKHTTLGRMCLEKAYEPVKAALEARSKFGGDLALAYMAIISNTDVYADMIEKGATPKEAAWVTLASTSAMFSVDKFAHLGEIFYDEMTADAVKESRRIARKEAAEAFDQIYKGGVKETPKSLWNKASKLGTRLGNAIGDFWYDLKNHSLGGVGKALGEGLEEVSEELATDISKGIYSLLGDMGLYEKSVENPIDWDTAFARYTMSFLGGAMGGGIFYAKEKFDTRFDKREDRELVDLIRDNKAAELRQAVMELKDRGRAGSTTLSGLDYVRGENGNITWLSTEDKSRSQNDVIADRIIDKINSLEATIVGNRANLSDDELFDRMVLGEARYQQYKNAAYVTGYYQEFKKRLNALIAAEQSLKAAEKTTDGNPGSPETATDAESRANPNATLRETNIAGLQEKVQAAKAALDDFLSGDTALEYTRKLNFVLDPVLNSAFLDLNYGEFVQEHMDFDPEDPESFDMQKWIDVQKAWIDKVKEVMSSDKVDKGFLAYTMLEKSVLQPMMEQAEVSKNYEGILNELQKLYELNPERTGYALDIQSFFKDKKQWNFNDRLIDENGVEESEEEWAARGVRETPEDELRYQKRKQRVEDLNRKLYQDYVNQFDAILAPIGYQIDASAARNIMQSMRIRIPDIIITEGLYHKVDGSSIFDPMPFVDLLKSLNDDLSNVDEVRAALVQRLYGLKKQEVDKLKGLIGQQFILDYGSDKLTTRADLVISQKTLAKKLDAITDDDVIAQGINAVNALATISPLVQYYLSTNAVTDKASYIEFVKFLKSEELDDFISSITDADSKVEYDDIVARIKASPALTLLYDQYISTNGEAKTREDMNRFGKFVTNYIKYDILGNILPKTMTQTSEDIQAIVSDLANTYSHLTVQQFIDALADPTSELYEAASLKNPVLPTELHKILSTAQMSFGKDVKAAILSSGDLQASAGETLKRQEDAVTRYLQKTIQRIKTNPFYEFYGKLQTSIHSPLEKMLEAVSTTLTPDGSSLNITDLLNGIYKSYVTADARDAFVLEPDTQEKGLTLAKKALDMVQAFIYAASTTPDGQHYFGQNKQINEFAASHKKELVKEWEPLPEIDARYATLLMQEQSKLAKEMELWRIISDSNAMNKLGRLVDTEAVHNQLRYEALRKIAKVFTIDDKEYKLTEGLDDLPETLDEGPNQLSQLFEAEQLVHDNFQRMLAESGKTAEELLGNEDFITTLLGLTPGNEEVKKQRVVSLTKGMTKISDFDAALQVLAVLTDNPSDYYRGLRSDIEANGKLPEDKQIAPLTVQQNASRLAEAASSKAFKVGFKTIAKIIKTPRTVTPNIIHIDGRAGAGKTEVVLKAVRHRYADESALVIGPTTAQAVKLQNSLNEATSYVFDVQNPNNIFALLLKGQWAQINSDIAKAQKKARAGMKSAEVQNADKRGESGEFRVSTEYFDLVYYYIPKDNMYGTRVELHKEKLNWSPEFTQKLVFIDEGAHMNAVQAALMDAYAEHVGGTVYIASDSGQDGYFQEPLENIGPTSLFCVRTAKLTESLRSSNIQMQSNGDKTAQILDTTEEVFSYGSEQAQVEWLNRLPDLMKTMQYRVYNGDDDINGYLFGANIAHVIDVLKKVQEEKQSQGEPITIGFIGSNDSLAYQAFKNAGLNVSEALTESPQPGKPFMQGQEFDYVFIDHLANVPEKLVPEYKSAVGFLKRFNTLATRGKVASMFADDLTGLFGNQVNDSQKSAGFSIKGQVAKFRDTYLESLKKLALREPVKPAAKPATTPEPEVTTPEIAPTAETPKSVADGSLDSVVEYNPEATAEEVKAAIEQSQDEIQKEVEEVVEPTSASDATATNFDKVTGDMVIEANLVMPVLSLEFSEPGVKSSTWKPFDLASEPKTGGIRRNLQCFVNTVTAPNGLTKLSEKQKFEDYIHKIQSFIIFGGKEPSIGLEGGRFDWSKATLQLEVRPATKLDEYGLDSEVKGGEKGFIRKNEKNYVVALVLKVDGVVDPNTDHTYTALFDICQMTDPTTLDTEAKQKEIIGNIEAKIKELGLKKTNPKASAETKAAIDKQIARMQAFANNLSTSAREYNKAITKFLTDHPEGGFIELESEDYKSHRTTRLRKRKSPRRLGTHVSIANIENNVRVSSGKHMGDFVKDTENFMEKDRRKVVSDVYIIGKQSDVLDGTIDPSVLGKAVVFTSSDTSIPKEDLVNRYIQQKLHPESHTPVVRMVILNNHGLSFSEVVYNTIRNAISTEAGGKEHKPWRMEVLGLRMYTALWNWRAGLINFNKALAAWKAKYGYSDSKVNNILRAEMDLFNSLKDSGEPIETVIKRADFKFSKAIGADTITEEDLRHLMEFNLEDCKDIPIFRLGFDTTQDIHGRSYGGYVRPFRISQNSSVYKLKKPTDSVNLFAISPAYALKYYNILDRILGQLTGTPESWSTISANHPLKSLNSKLVKVSDSAEGGYVDFAKDEYIGKDSYHRTLSGLIKTIEGKLVIQETAEDGKSIQRIASNSDSQFDYLPRALATLVKSAKSYQERQGQKTGLVQVETRKTVSQGEDIIDYFDLDVAELFGDDLLDDGVSGDNTLMNLMDLIFHGTTQSLEEWRKPREGKLKRPYIEDAFAKFGFFVDPGLMYSEEAHTLNVRPTGEKSGYTFLRCGTSPAYFDVDVDVIPGGIAVNLSAIVEGFKHYGEARKKAKTTTSEEAPKPSPLESISGYAATVPETDRQGFWLEVQNSPDITNDEEGYKLYKERSLIKQIEDVFNHSMPEPSDINAINNFLQERGKNVTIQSIDNNTDGVLSVTTTEGIGGKLTLRHDEDFLDIEVKLMSLGGPAIRPTETANGEVAAAERDIRNLLSQHLDDNPVIQAWLETKTAEELVDFFNNPENSDDINLAIDSISDQNIKNEIRSKLATLLASC